MFFCELFPLSPCFRSTALNSVSIAAFAPLGVAVRIALDDWFAACPTTGPKAFNPGYRNDLIH